jgi:hypothetical protein
MLYVNFAMTHYPNDPSAAQLVYSHPLDFITVDILMNLQADTVVSTLEDRKASFHPRTPREDSQDNPEQA